ncbi:MAG: endolytic transglycosylase MltG [Deltaproteobacteria bacterium]|nr:endolytic transglycosylase MltG [Deltaproteobacteria bacterium]
MLLLLVACDLERAPGPPGAPVVVFEVPKGATARGLGDELAALGLVQSQSKWDWYIRLNEAGGCIKAGKHELSASMSAREIVEALCGVPIPDEVAFTVLEGWRVRDIDAALVEKGFIEPGAFIEAASGKEGYLFPETYMVPADGFDAAKFVERQLTTFDERFGKAYSGERPLGEVVVVASMLEREEPSPANRPMVAGIMYKRLVNDWNLGIDATSRYTLADWNNREDFLEKLRDPADPYNTRLRPGLPPTPIGNPSLASLEAAAAPTESEFWYYLHDKDGVLHPSRNVREHEAYRRKYNVY